MLFEIFNAKWRISKDMKETKRLESLVFFDVK